MATIEQMQEYMKAAVDSYGEGYFGEDNLPEEFVIAESGDWVQDGKYQYSSDIYSDADGNFWCINNHRSGSYHTDWYYSEPTVRQVKKVEKTVVITNWEPV